MNTNTSATGGYIVPNATPAPIYDTALNRVIQQAVVGITGLAGALVRPRWQPNPPAQPEATVNWCAIGITTVGRDFDPYMRHDGGQSGKDLFTRNETLDVLASFYGPDGFSYAALLADGLALSQNRAALRSVGIKLGFTGGIVSAPALVNLRWLWRADLHIEFHREVRREYPILNFTRLPAVAVTDNGLHNALGCPPPEEV